jgi:hypothetical protein
MQDKQKIYSIRVVVLIIMLIQLSCFVYADQTTINIKTLPKHKVQVTLLDASSENSLIQRFENYSDSNGKVDFNIGIENTESMHILIFVKKDGETILSEKYLENYEQGKSFDFELLPEEIAEKSSNLLIYALVGFVSLLLFLVLCYKKRKPKQSEKIRIIKYKDWQETMKKENGLKNKL